MRTCQAEVGGSQEDVDPFIKREMLSTYKSKCILDCVNEKLGYVSALFQLFCAFFFFCGLPSFCARKAAILAHFTHIHEISISHFVFSSNIDKRWLYHS